VNKGFGKNKKKFKNLENINDELSVVKVNYNEVDVILKKYKKLRKYMNTSIFEIKTMDGTETIINDLLAENND
jgi:hypothetical protein